MSNIATATTSLDPRITQIMRDVLRTEEYLRWVKEYDAGDREIWLNDAQGLSTRLSIRVQREEYQQTSMEF